jgi:hypothetical protein
MRLAKLTSNIINPFLVSSAVIVLLSFESTSTSLDAIKWASISIALSIIPVFIVIVYLVRHKKLDGIFVNPHRQRRKVYILASSVAVAACFFLYWLGAPRLLVVTFTAGLVAIVAFMLINLAWKISLHTAFIAASVTVLTIVYGYLGALTAILVPPVAWARIKLDYHTLWQVTTGALLSVIIVFTVFFLFGETGN